MTGHNTLIAGLGTATAAAAGGPLAQVFGELAIVQAIMGFGGAVAMAVHKKEPIKVTGLSGCLGGVLAVGLGAVSEAVLSKVFGLSLGDGVSGAQASAAYSFAIGLAQRPIYEWFSKKTGGDDD